jgi:hypothetical protein
LDFNLPVLIAYTVIATALVLWHARRLNRAEAERSDDWDMAAPSVIAWTLLTLLVSPLAFPAYWIRTKRPLGAVAGVVAAVAACWLALTLDPTHKLESPFATPPPLKWTPLPPGLPPAARKAVESIKSEKLAFNVHDLLPGLIDLGQHYEQGAEITIDPGETEARIIMELKEDGFICIMAVRVFTDGAVTTGLFADDTRGKKVRRIKNREAVLEGPLQAPGKDGATELQVNLFERYQHVLTHLLVVEDPKARDAPGHDANERELASVKLTMKVGKQLSDVLRTARAGDADTLAH